MRAESRVRLRPARLWVQTASHDALPRRKFLDPELNEVGVVFPTSRNSYAARGRQAEAPGSIGAARGVCSHPGRAARHESPEGELRRLAGYDQTLARRGSFFAPRPVALGRAHRVYRLCNTEIHRTLALRARFRLEVQQPIRGEQDAVALLEPGARGFSTLVQPAALDLGRAQVRKQPARGAGRARGRLQGCVAGSEGQRRRDRVE